MGMTNEQYKGLLIDQRQAWQDLKRLLEDGKEEEAREKVEKQLRNIEEKLEF